MFLICIISFQIESSVDVAMKGFSQKQNQFPDSDLTSTFPPQSVSGPLFWEGCEVPWLGKEHERDLLLMALRARKTENGLGFFVVVVVIWLF